MLVHTEFQRFLDGLEKSLQVLSASSQLALLQHVAIGILRTTCISAKNNAGAIRQPSEQQ
jgi:hypothetical protein